MRAKAFRYIVVTNERPNVTPFVKKARTFKLNRSNHCSVIVATRLLLVNIQTLQSNVMSTSIRVSQIEEIGNRVVGYVVGNFQPIQDPPTSICCCGKNSSGTDCSNPRHVGSIVRRYLTIRERSVISR